MGEFFDAGQSRAGWHRIESYAACRRKGAASATRKYREVGIYLCRGVLIHAGLQHHYLRMQAKQRGQDVSAIMTPTEAIIEAARREIEKAPEDQKEEWVDARDFLITHDAMNQYAAYYATHPRVWEILEVEREYEMQIPDPVRGGSYLYTQRSDLTIRDIKTKMVWIIDHKGTGRIGTETVNKYALSGQRAGYYLHGYNTYGRDFGGVIFSFIQYPPTPKAGEAPKITGWKYDMPAMMDAHGAIDDVKKAVIHIERWLIDFARDNGGTLPADIMEYPPILAPGAPCYSTYGRCPLFDACRTGDIKILD